MKSSKIFRILLWREKEKTTLKSVGRQNQKISLLCRWQRETKKFPYLSANTVLLSLGVILKLKTTNNLHTTKFLKIDKPNLKPKSMKTKRTFKLLESFCTMLFQLAILQLFSDNALKSNGTKPKEFHFAEENPYVWARFILEGVFCTS